MTDQEIVLSAYITCALWSSPAFVKIADDGTITEDSEDDRSFLDHNFDADDLTETARDTMRADVEAFVDDAGSLLDDLDPEQVGHDFWLTRNGHGAGFWDRGLGDLGDELTKLAKPYGSCDLFAHVDGTIDIG